MLSKALICYSQDEEIARSLVDSIKASEGAYQEGLRMAYVDLAENTFKSLRRNLPITRNKIDWDKVCLFICFSLSLISTIYVDCKLQDWFRAGGKLNVDESLC
jgi:hypothetical protein